MRKRDDIVIQQDYWCWCKIKHSMLPPNGKKLKMA